MLMRFLRAFDAMNDLFDIPDDSELYDRKHPQIWAEFKRITFQLISRGCKHYGSKAIFEVIRFHTAIEAEGEPFKINNNHTKYYAEKFMRIYPQHEGFFELREKSVA